MASSRPCVAERRKESITTLLPKRRSRRASRMSTCSMVLLATTMLPIVLAGSAVLLILLGISLEAISTERQRENILAIPLPSLQTGQELPLLVVSPVSASFDFDGEARTWTQAGEVEGAADYVVISPPMLTYSS
jgi:hypothetical protein